MRVGVHKATHGVGFESQRHELGGTRNAQPQWTDAPCVKFLWSCVQLVPGKRSARLVLDNTGFKEVTFLLQVNHFTHPRERIFLVRE